MLFAHCTSSGKILLADLPWNEVIDRVERSGGLVARTPKSMTSLETLSGELAEVREQGWARNRGEADVGVSGVAVPVHSPDGNTIAALGVSVASERFDGVVRLHLRLIQKVARQLEKAIADEIALASHESVNHVDYPTVPPMKVEQPTARSREPRPRHSGTAPVTA